MPAPAPTLSFQPPAHGGGDGKAVVFAQIVLGVVLVLRSVARNLALVGILDIIVKGGSCAAFIEIALPGGIKARGVQGVLVAFLLRRLFFYGLVRLFCRYRACCSPW